MIDSVMPNENKLNHGGYESYCPHATQKRIQEITPAILEMCDTISEQKLPPFPGFDESAEVTIYEACATLTPEQIGDLVNYYCGLHGLQSPLAKSHAQAEQLPVFMPLNEPSLL